MSNEENIVKVKISKGASEDDASTYIDRWLSYEIDSDILSPCDAFHFTCPNIDGRMVGVIKPEDEITISVDNEIICTGIVDDVEYQGTENGAIVDIAGRDFARWLVDCAADVFSLKEQTLKTLAEKLTERWGLIWSVSGNPTLPRVKKMKIDPGETIMDVLTRFAEPAKCIVWMSPDGTGVIGKPDYDQEVSYKLCRYKRSSQMRNRNNIIDGSLRKSTRERFSSITVLSSVSNTAQGGLWGSSSGSLFGSSGSSASKLKGTATDDEIKDKPKIITYGNAANTSQAKTRAEEEIQRGKFGSLIGTYKTWGHKNEGKIWKVNTICSVVDEYSGLQGDPLFVTRRRFTCDAQGKQTEVELHPIDVFLPSDAMLTGAKVEL